MKNVTIKNIWALVRRNIPVMFFGKKKLRLAFEYGLVMSDMAHEMKIPLTKEVVARAEEILVHSWSHNSTERVALDMVPNILAAIETKI